MNSPETKRFRARANDQIGVALNQAERALRDYRDSVLGSYWNEGSSKEKCIKESEAAESMRAEVDALFNKIALILTREAE